MPDGGSSQEARDGSGMLLKPEDESIIFVNMLNERQQEAAADKCRKDKRISYDQKYSV